jgi:hypothetical protein
MSVYKEPGVKYLTRIGGLRPTSCPKSGIVTSGAAHYSTSMRKNILIGNIYQEWVIQ